jgi:hypothetical protein
MSPTGYEVEFYRNIAIIAQGVRRITTVLEAQQETAEDDGAAEVLALIAGSPSLSKAQIMGKAQDWLRENKKGGTA